MKKRIFIVILLIVAVCAILAGCVQAEEMRRLDPEMPYMEAQTTAWGMNIIIVFTVILTLIVSAPVYIFQSLGLYAIAKRRGIQYPGLAWVPVANMYIQGNITDDYNQRFENKKTHYKHLLLWLGAGQTLISSIYSVIYVKFFTNLMNLVIVYQGQEMPQQFPELMMAFFGQIMIIGFLMFVVGIAYAVFYYIALHKLYKSCTKNYVVLLVLSIIFNIIIPFVIFAIRNNDIYPEMPAPNVDIQKPPMLDGDIQN